MLKLYIGSKGPNSFSYIPIDFAHNTSYPTKWTERGSLSGILFQEKEGEKFSDMMVFGACVCVVTWQFKLHWMCSLSGTHASGFILMMTLPKVLEWSWIFKYKMMERIHGKNLVDWNVHEMYWKWQDMGRGMHILSYATSTIVFVSQHIPLYK